MPELPRRRLLAAAALLALPAAARAAAAEDAAPPAIAALLPGAKLQGRGTFRYFGFVVYTASLWVGPQGLGEPLTAQPFALQLRYARRLKGRDIAERSDEEMRRLDAGSSAQRRQWLQRMIALFPDVRDGDWLAGVYTPQDGGRTRFLFNGQPLGDIPGRDFAAAFFAIWLSPQTSAPALRAELLGRADR